MWYNYDKVLSYHAMLNFIVGERGVGKSYGIKKYCIKKFKKKKRKFIYLRRYDTELQKSLKDNEFFKDICKDEEFKNDKFNVRGDKFICNDSVCGYAIPLSKASIFKSVPFPDVDIIIYDEYLIDNTTYRYINDEPEKLLDFMETVGRLRDIQVFLLGNSISQINPYFDYFNISLPYNNDIKTFKDGLILINYIKNEKYREVKHQSKFGKLIEGTKYSKYAIDNEFLKDNKTFIAKKTSQSKMLFKLIINNHTYGLWIDNTNKCMYVAKNYDDYSPTITFTNSDHNEKTILLKSKSVFFKNMIKHYEMGLLYFENLQIKTDVMEIIRKTKK